MTERKTGVTAGGGAEGTFRAGLEDVFGEVEELGLGHWFEVWFLEGWINDGVRLGFVVEGDVPMGHVD